MIGKISFSIWVMAICAVQAVGQINIDLVSNYNVSKKHSSRANDIWGWVDGVGNEYAIVGLMDGTSIIDVTDASNPKEVFYEAGMNSPWRDMKTWKSYAYITTEAKNGLLIIDMSKLPGDTILDVSYYRGSNSLTWESAHNLYIDEKGVAYIFGAYQEQASTKRNVVMLDVDSDPMNPAIIGVLECDYVHDGYARGDTLYLAHILDGYFSIWDIKNKSNPVQLGKQYTGNTFTHQLWISDDASRIFINDEVANGYLEEYDISDFGNIKFNGRVQTAPGSHVVPHNTFFVDDYLVTAYYHDGVTVHDVSQPGNMIEVGSYDTDSTIEGPGYSGSWGVYPYLPSGNIIATDDHNGLYVFKPNYVRGCYLEGSITEEGSGVSIGNVSIDILGTAANTSSSVVGKYQTGYHQSGTYSVEFSAPFHFPKTVQGVKLENGTTTVQDVQLKKMETVVTRVKIEDQAGNSIAGGKVELVSKHGAEYQFETGANGVSVTSKIVVGQYDIAVGAWGWKGTCLSDSIKLDDTELVFVLKERGYKDDFSLDLGWQSQGVVGDGKWERGIPVPKVQAQIGVVQDTVSPFSDIESDCGDNVFITGLESLLPNGKAGTLQSPVMDLSSYIDPYLYFSVWGYSGYFGEGVKVELSSKVGGSNIKKSKKLHVFKKGWVDIQMRIKDLIDLSEEMKVAIVAGSGSKVNVALDDFEIIDSSANNIYESTAQGAIKIYNNPFSNSCILEYVDLNMESNLIVLDCMGQLMDKINVRTPNGVVKFGEGLGSGIYLIGLEGSNSFSRVVKL